MRRWITAAAVLLFLEGMIMQTPAECWTKDSRGWRYAYGVDYYPSDTWKWIDGDADGKAECYYLDRDGYCLTDTVTEDGYTVNSDGAWIVNGIVQIKDMKTGQVTGESDAKIEIKKGNASPLPVSDLLYLLDTDPDEELGFVKYENAVTNHGETWHKGFYLYANRWTRYYTAGNYGTLKLTVSPSKYAFKDQLAIITILGDDDRVLYKSGYILSDSGTQSIVVDISGQKHIKIQNGTLDGRSMQILFKDGMLEK